MEKKYNEINILPVTDSRFAVEVGESQECSVLLTELS